MTDTSLKLEGLQKIKSDFKHLLSTFKEMLQSLGEEDLAALITLKNDQALKDYSKVPEEKLA